MSLKRLLFLGLLVVALPITGYSQETCYAFFEGGRMTVGNSLIERTFTFGRDGLKTVSVTDKLHNNSYECNSEGGPDLDFGAKSASSPSFCKAIVPATPTTPAHLSATISWKADGMEIRREYRLYDGVSAIACDTYIRGQVAIAKPSKDDSADAIGVENLEDLSRAASCPSVLDRFLPGGKHWRFTAVEFRDITDANNNLVTEVRGMAYRNDRLRGNLLFARDTERERGFYFLKEAPCSHTQIGYEGADFVVSQGAFEMIGAGFTAEDLSLGGWVKAYSCVLGVYDGSELDALTSLRGYQRQLRTHLPDRDEMVMMNTWGDRSRDTKVNQQFCLQELEKGARLGISHFQIDDGWQSGKGQNSALAKGSYKDIYKQKAYWEPDPVKYPDGLQVVVDRGKELGIEVGLWFTPSAQNEFEDWEKDAQTIIGLYEKYGIRVFKVDGWTAPTKLAEANFRRFVDRVMEKTGGAVLLNLDSTAQRRQGYHMMCEYGNIFLENRYTDWGNYYPYKTLRNLWMLSKYVPAERLQVEFLNKWRNAENYKDDPYAPSLCSFDYLFAITMAGQPLAWMEASNLPEEAYDIAPLIRSYRALMPSLHSGVILPIGDEPSGRSWTGFQSILSDKEGYFIIYRENHPSAEGYLCTWLPEGAKVRLTPILGTGTKRTEKILRNGELKCTIPEVNGFAVYRYYVK